MVPTSAIWLVGWVTNGTTTWTGHGAVTHDGTDAARSPVLANNGSAWMQTTLAGPTTVSFWWKVSSEPNDRLRFLVDGSEQAGISGDVDWQYRAFPIAAGNHTVRWQYLKDGGTAGGSDRAWVDQIVLGAMAPVITAQPTNRAVNAGSSASFTVGVAASAPIGYRWHFNGTPLTDGAGVTGSGTATLNLANVQAARAGAYSVLVSNALGTVMSSNASLFLFHPVSVAEALDNATLAFTTGGTTTEWAGQQLTSYDGEDAVQTGVMDDSTYSWIKATVNGPGTLTFWWKTSTELDHDYLRFILDGADQMRISGEVGWQQIVFSVPSGSHELQWRYSRSPSGVGGQDRAWLDRVIYTPGGTVVDAGDPPQIQIQPISRTVDENETADFSVSAIGAVPLHYRWLYEGTNVIADGGNIGGATTPELTIFNALLSQGGNYSVIVSNAAGSVTSLVARLTVNDVLFVHEAIDQPEWSVFTGGSRPWDGNTVITHDGQHAARSGMVDHNQSSTMQTIVDGPGWLRFWWRASSETNADVLAFAVNGLTAATLSGESSWQEYEYELMAGPQFIDWTYFKNGTGAEGEDRGYVDQVTFTPAGSLAAAPKAKARSALTPRITVDKGVARLQWLAETRSSYEVYYKESLADTEWKLLDSEVLAKWTIKDGNVIPDRYHATVDDLPGGRTRFYRVLEY